MPTLLNLSTKIDLLNEWVGHIAKWLILFCVLISAGNAVMRKFFNLSSNSMLEIQWYLFAAVFLFCAGHVLKHNEHVRIDVLTGRLGHKALAWVDIIGALFFLLPLTGIVIYLSWDVFVSAWHSKEMSSNAGGLIIWPARLFVPLGFALLFAQGCSEIIKRVAFLRGQAPYPQTLKEKTAEEELAMEIAKQIKGDKHD